MYTPSFHNHRLSEYRLSSPFEISFDNLVTVIDVGERFLLVDIAHDGSTITFDHL